MVIIYCLVDPRTNTPFYVGATKNPKRRLIEHWSDVKLDRFMSSGTSQKYLFIKELRAIRIKPILNQLMAVNENDKKYWEGFCLNSFIDAGFKLKQNNINYEQTDRIN